MKSYYKPGDWIGTYLKSQRMTRVNNHISGRLLDIACGENDIVNSYAGEGVGIDVQNYGADQVVKNYHDLPFESAWFDTITIIASINYFEKPEKVLKEVFRLLKSDGQLIVTNSNAHVMKIWHMFRESWAYKSGYSEAHLMNMLKENGFKAVNRTSFNFFLSYVLVLKKDV